MRITPIKELFNQMHGSQASSWQKTHVEKFRIFYEYININEDLDFCFEVLAGKHKLGFTMPLLDGHTTESTMNGHLGVKQLYRMVAIKTMRDKSESNIAAAVRIIPLKHRQFMCDLANRVYKLGYTNKNNMVTDKHCMLARSYPEHFPTNKGWYYIQEKLNGNRCIAYYEDDQWKFLSRSQKPLNVNFDMTGLDTDCVYDGEIMTKNKMGNRDFAATTGAINSKYGDKTGLVYFIYDILDASNPYSERYKELQKLEGKTSHNVEILKVLGRLELSPNINLNFELDVMLDAIVEKGGEGVMLRAEWAPYHHSKHSGDRKHYLLKYKKTKTCDLRITGWNEGKGKYEGYIGSFICEDDEKTIKVNVAGMTDDIRMSDPNFWIGKIIEVAYFESSKAKNKSVLSLQFPRMKAIRNDKTETSTF